MGKLREHINAVGVDAALEAIGEDAGQGDGQETQYEGRAFDMSTFCEAYLNRFGINALPEVAETSDKGKRLVSSASPTFAKQVRPDPYLSGDFSPRDPTFKNKLDEAKHLLGLESSEDIGVIMGQPVTHLTPDVAAKMDERYGPGQWIIKAYGDDAFAGHGIWFPQRVAQVRQNARDTIWQAGEQVGRYGFQLRRDASGKVVGLQHQGGDQYDFGTEKYANTINGDVRMWADRAAAEADNEQGAALFDREGNVSGKDFMAQPAFKAVGISDEERARGVTGAEGGKGEGRVHIVTRNGKAEIVPHATWIKGEHLPVVFENEQTRAMAQAAVDAINALPESERQGQIYAPDVMPSASGFKVVEANPANETGSSGYLGDNPFVIDSYVSHLTGREPAHVQFIRKLLSAKNDEQANDMKGRVSNGQSGSKQGKVAPGTAGGSGGASSKSGSGSVGGDDTRATEGFDRTKSENAHHPEKAQGFLSGVKQLSLPGGDAERWEHDPQVRDAHNREVLDAAKKNDFFVHPDEFSRVTKSPNIGGNEHDVHEDAENNRFFKFTKNANFGQNKDVHEYLKRHELANRFWPSLGYKVHGVTQSPFTGHAQVVTSMNRVEGSHPEQQEIHDWFQQNGWVPHGDEATSPDGDSLGQWSWQDPKTGAIVDDAHAKNFIKTKGGLVPIDVDIQPGEAVATEAKSPVISQEEARKQYFPDIESKGRRYNKTSQVQAEVAKGGEKIDTVTSDGKETSNVAKPGDMIVTNPGGERYVMPAEKFNSRYKDLGGGKYQATGSIRAHKYDGPDTEFTASWGEPMKLKKGDMVASPLDKDGKPTGEIYRIADKEFRETYGEHFGSKQQPYWRPGANPTVDNVITRDHPETGEKQVLLIKRKAGTVEGDKWALPGGFHDSDAPKGHAWKEGKETAQQAAIRELAEETGLDAKELTDKMQSVGEYEGNKRDPRDNDESWSKSSAFALHLDGDMAKRAVAGQDDASDAKWVSASELGKHQLAFDHGKILKDAKFGASDEPKAADGAKSDKSPLEKIKSLHDSYATSDYSEIRSTVRDIADSMDADELGKIASQFGIHTVKGKSKKVIADKIIGKIEDRKGSWERGQAIAKAGNTNDEEEYAKKQPETPKQPAPPPATKSAPKAPASAPKAKNESPKQQPASKQQQPGSQARAQKLIAAQLAGKSTPEMDAEFERLTPTKDHLTNVGYMRGYGWMGVPGVNKDKVQVASDRLTQNYSGEPPIFKAGDGSSEELKAGTKVALEKIEAGDKDVDSIVAAMSKVMTGQSPEKLKLAAKRIVNLHNALMQPVTPDEDVKGEDL